jgi:hypothetical protein
MAPDGFADVWKVIHESMHKNMPLECTLAWAERIPKLISGLLGLVSLALQTERRVYKSRR